MDTSGQSICPSAHLLLWTKEEGLGTRENGTLRQFDMILFQNSLRGHLDRLHVQFLPFPPIFPNMRIILGYIQSDSHPN